MVLSRLFRSAGLRRGEGGLAFLLFGRKKFDGLARSLWGVGSGGCWLWFVKAALEWQQTDIGVFNTLSAGLVSRLGPSEPTHGASFCSVCLQGLGDRGHSEIAKSHHTLYYLFPLRG
jgi:hypothetical protein